MTSNKKYRITFLLVALALVFALPGASLADHPHPQPATPFITLTGDGELTPIINSGEGIP
jgi:hypothetical protein